MVSPAKPAPASRRGRLAWLLLGLVVVVALAWRYAPTKADSADAVAPAATTTSPATPKPAGQVSRPPAGSVAANDDMSAAFAAALQLPAPAQRQPEFGRLVREWSTRDAEAVIAYLRQMPRGPEFSLGLGIVLDALSRTNVDRALQLAAELAATPAERAFYFSLFARLAADDVAGAVSRLALVPPGESRLNSIRALTDAWAGRDLEAAINWARGLSVAPERSAAVESALAALVATDPLRAVELALASLGEPERSRVVAAGLRALNESDPAAAASLVAMLPAGALQMQTAIDVARALARRDLPAALRWLDTLPAGDVRHVALNNVLSIWAGADAAAAGDYVSRLAPGSAQNAAASHYATLLAASAPTAAIAWAQALPGGPARDSAFISVASAWSRQEPAAASRWASSLPAGEAQRTALNGALSYWLLQAPEATGDFVRGLAPGLQPGAAEFVAPLLAQNNPAATLSWAESLPVAAAREAAITAAYTRWLDNAPAQAHSWLAQSNLVPEFRARLQAIETPR